MRASKKTDLLAAAGTLIVRDGLEALTFDRLAAEAQVSKGGLLYHFPDKGRLLIALVEGRAARIDAAIAARIAADAGARTAGRWLRAYIRIALANDADSNPPAVLLGILRGGLPPDSPALAALSAADGRWRDAACADGLPRGLALTICLAVAGAAGARLTSQNDTQDIADVRDALLALTAR